MPPPDSYRAVLVFHLLAMSLNGAAAQTPVPRPPKATTLSASAPFESSRTPLKPAGLAGSTKFYPSNVVFAFSTLATLPGHAIGGLTEGGDGNFYGVLESFASFNQALVFQVTTGGVLTILHSFTGGDDSTSPFAGLVLGKDGSFYGTDSLGGNNSIDPAGAGTVFKTTTNGDFTLLYSFSGGGDGDTPFAALVQGTNGEFYGTTKYGGAYGYGVVFALTNGGPVRTLHAFGASGGVQADGAIPGSALVFGTNGGLYGTTQSGGANGLGTVFEITANGTLTTLDSFNATNGGSVPGVPGPQLTLAPDGSFYGTTYGGGLLTNGSVFRLSQGGTITTIHSFTGGGDGAAPAAALVPGTDGGLYGTASGGGNNTLDPAGAGTVFKITTNGSFTLLYSFAGGSDGDTPLGALTLAAGGRFYGATKFGGDDGYGVLYAVTPDGSAADIYSFDFTVTEAGVAFENGAAPAAALVLGTNGGLYGTTRSGGANGLGTVFSLAPGGGLATLDSFTAANGGAGAGLPGPQLVLGPDGNLYGTTFGGGAWTNGTVFQILCGGGQQRRRFDHERHRSARRDGSSDHHHPTTQRNRAHGRARRLHGHRRRSSAPPLSMAIQRRGHQRSRRGEPDLERRLPGPGRKLSGRGRRSVWTGHERRRGLDRERPPAGHLEATRRSNRGARPKRSFYGDGRRLRPLGLPVAAGWDEPPGSDPAGAGPDESGGRPGRAPILSWSPTSLER